MSETKKIKTPVAYQCIRWKSKHTSRGIKHRKITVFTQQTNSVPSTLNHPLTPEEQYDYSGDQPEPLYLPHSTVYLSNIMLVKSI
jgi:hypothetical protein